MLNQMRTQGFCFLGYVCFALRAKGKGLGRWPEGPLYAIRSNAALQAATRNNHVSE